MFCQVKSLSPPHAKLGNNPFFLRLTTTSAFNKNSSLQSLLSRIEEGMKKGYLSASRTADIIIYQLENDRTRTGKDDSNRPALNSII
jgi:hypothetical protein